MKGTKRWMRIDTDPQIGPMTGEEMAEILTKHPGSRWKPVYLSDAGLEKL